MDDFTVKIGVLNAFGLVLGQANLIAPGKRPLSSMSPTIVTKNGHTVMVLGTPGGSRLVTAVLHTIVNVIDYDMTVQEAVDAPRFHQQSLPEATHLEPYALSPDTLKILENRCQKFSHPQPPNGVAAILVGAPSLGGQPWAGTAITARTIRGATPGSRSDTEPCPRAGTVRSLRATSGRLKADATISRDNAASGRGRHWDIERLPDCATGSLHAPLASADVTGRASCWRRRWERFTHGLRERRPGTTPPRLRALRSIHSRTSDRQRLDRIARACRTTASTDRTGNDCAACRIPRGSPGGRCPANGRMHRRTGE